MSIMNKRIGIPVLFVILIIYLVLINNYESQKIELRERINSVYPGSELIGEPRFEQDCLICEGEECAKLGEPCWKARIQDSRGEREVAVKTGGEGEAAGGGKILDSSPVCPGCTLDSCDDQYTYQTSGGSVTLYNSGCNNPLPVCDPQTHDCRACIINQDCLSYSVTVYGSYGDKFYEYGIVGSGLHGNYIGVNQKCILYYGSENIYSNETTEPECKQVALSHAYCNQGVCEYR